MTIMKIQCYPYRVPLRHDFTTAHSTLKLREGAIVEVHVEGHSSGIGEIAPMPEFGGEALHDALEALSSLATQLTGQSVIEALNYLSALREVGDLPAATTCGLEIALLDALGKQEGCSISILLAPPTHRRSVVPVNAVVGAQTIAAAVQQANAAVAAGFRCLKLKMGDGLHDEIERVSAVRKAIGPEVHLRLDGNEAWSLEQAQTILTACEPLNIQYAEQPLRAYDLNGMYQLRQTVSIPVAADEAIYHLESAQRVLEWGAADILIIKPQLVGGLRAAQRIIYEAARHNVPCVITSMIEAGIGLLGTLHLAAALPHLTLECGLATLPLLADDLVVEDILIHNGVLTVPQGPGLGVELDRIALGKYSQKV